MVNRDYRDLLAAFAAHDVRFLIVGAPNRIDVLTSVDGLQFEDCWGRRVTARYGDVDAHCLAKADLITNKRTVARPQDLEDVRALEREP